MRPSIAAIALVLASLAPTGCTDPQARWKIEYEAMVKKWETDYSGSDAQTAYTATLAYADYLKKMQREEVPFDAPKVLVWVYARLGLLAEHLGRKEESARHFATAARYAKTIHPQESADNTSEASFRSALDQMDSPDSVAWRKSPNHTPAHPALSR